MTYVNLACILAGWQYSLKGANVPLCGRESLYLAVETQYRRKAMLGKVLSHPMTILAMLYASCVLTTAWMAISRRLDDLHQQPAATRS